MLGLMVGLSPPLLVKLTVVVSEISSTVDASRVNLLLV